MAVLPSYDSSVRPTKTQAQSFTSVEGAKTTGKNIASVGKALQEVNTVWQNLTDYNEELTEQNKADASIAQIKSAAENDPDHKNQEIYNAQLEEVYNNVGQFSNNIVGQKFRGKIRGEIGVAKANMTGTFKKKEIDHTAGQLELKERDAKKKFIHAKDEAAATSIRDALILKFAEANAAYLLTDEDYQKKITSLDKWDAERQDAQIQNLLNISPELAEDALTKGAYKDMDVGDKASWLKIIDSAKKQRQAEIDQGYKDLTDAKNTKMTKQFFNDTLTVGELNKGIKEDETKGGPDTKYLLSMRDKLYSAQKDRLDTLLKTNAKPRALTLLMEKIIPTRIELMAARELLLDAWADGVISKEEGAQLEDLKTKMDDIQHNKSSNWFVIGYRAVQDARGKGNDSTENLASDLREFLLGMSKEGADPTQVSKEIVERRQKKNYPEYQDWEVGKPYDSIIGAVKKLNVESDGMPIVERLNAR